MILILFDVQGILILPILKKILALPALPSIPDYQYSTDE
jgi:hypothetical protein